MVDRNKLIKEGIPIEVLKQKKTIGDLKQLDKEYKNLIKNDR